MQCVSAAETLKQRPKKAADLAGLPGAFANCGPFEFVVTLTDRHPGIIQIGTRPQNQEVCLAAVSTRPNSLKQLTEEAKRL